MHSFHTKPSSFPTYYFLYETSNVGTRPPDSPSPCSSFHCSQNRPSKDAAHSLQAIFERQTCYADQPPWYLSYPKGGCHAHSLNPLSPFTASENGFAGRSCASSSNAAHPDQKANTCDKGIKTCYAGRPHWCLSYPKCGWHEKMFTENPLNPRHPLLPESSVHKKRERAFQQRVGRKRRSHIRFCVTVYTNARKEERG